MTYRVIFVAVVYNNYRDTYDFCQSLNRLWLGGIERKCFIVDNSDSDVVRKQVDALLEEYEFVSIIRPDRNLGYFGAFNYFFENFSCEHHDAVVLCNNDLVLDDSFCVRLSSADYPPDAMVICPDVITVDGVHQNPHVLQPLGLLARFKLDLYFTHYFLARCLLIVKSLIHRVRPFRRRTDRAPSGYLHLGIGACYVLLPSFLKVFGRLDYPHFIYGEEAYLTRQVHALGGRLYYDSTLTVLHKESATLSKLPSRVTYEYGRDGYWKYRRFY